jgi:hypothetical protein
VSSKTPTRTPQGGSPPRAFTVTAFGEGSFRETQFFEDDHEVVFAALDSRFEFWLPPGRESFSWGPYVRFAGVSSSGSEAFENAYLAKPGLGIQLYPFSTQELRTPGDRLGELLGPLRVFAEYNKLDYWGSVNDWRPDDQQRVGAEYWRARGVNDPFLAGWHELWSGAIWQSSNEFDDQYDTWIAAAAMRAGARIGPGGPLSYFTPYLAVEGSRTTNDAYYWENRLLTGCGVRWTPSENWLEGLGLDRFVVFLEYLFVAAEFADQAPSAVPDTDMRFGLSISLGQWFK